MGLLAPLFLLGLAAIAAPVVIHMIQRERKEDIPFPSLMFVRKIPFRSFRRQRIRHWFLLLLRCAALVLLLLAFARPFFPAGALGAAVGGAREVVVLLDRSWSMGYDGAWEAAQLAAADMVRTLGPDDRVTLILFDGGAEAGPRATTDHAAVIARIDAAAPGAGVTRYGPALQLAAGLLDDSTLPRLEAVLVSDFQRAGVESARGVRLPPGTTLTPIRVGGGHVAGEAAGDEAAAAPNVSVAGVLFQREYFSGRERVQVAARLTNRSPAPVAGRAVTLVLEAREVETLTADLPPNGSTTVDFAPVTLGAAPVPGSVRIAPDALPADDIFHFVVSPGQVVPVLIVDSGRAQDDANLFLTRALGIGSAPAFDVRTTTAGALTAADLAGRQVVVLNDTPPPPGAAGQALADFVAAGGGLLVVAGERSAWPQGAPDLLPGRIGPPADRAGRGGSLGFVDYSHPVFAVFAAPRSGDVTSPRFFRTRPVEPDPSAAVLARFDDGAPALTERPVGRGAVLLWASTIDAFWNDFAKKPVYLPFVHRMVEHLAAYAPPTPWFTVGQVLDLADRVDRADAPAGAAPPRQVVMSPSGDRIPLRGGDRAGDRAAAGAGFIDLTEQGFYEVRDADAPGARPVTLAVNVDLAESTLTAVDPAELAGMVTGRAGAAPGAAPDDTARALDPAALERRQSVWWYLLAAAAALFLTETLVSNRLSREARAEE